MIRCSDHQYIGEVGRTTSGLNDQRDGGVPSLQERMLEKEQAEVGDISLMLSPRAYGGADQRAAGSMVSTEQSGLETESWG